MVAYAVSKLGKKGKMAHIGVQQDNADQQGVALTN